MSSRWPKPGPNHAPSYQVSGIPYTTSSAPNEIKGHDTASEPIHIEFPFVTRWFSIRCTETAANRALRVGFTRNGVYGPTSGSYIVLPKHSATQDVPIRFDLAVKELFFTSDSPTLGTDFTLMAGLTNIPASSFPTLTGSSGVEGVG